MLYVYATNLLQYNAVVYWKFQLLYIPSCLQYTINGKGGGAKFDCYSSNNFSEFLLLRKLLNLKFNVKCTGIKLLCLINKDEQLLFGDRPLSSLITICMLFNDSLVCMRPMHEFVFFVDQMKVLT